MPTPLDTKLRAKALDLLDTLGQRPTSYLQATKGAFDPSTDTAVVTYTERASTINKLAPLQVVSHGMLRGLPEGVVKLGDGMTYMAASGSSITPAVGDRITFLGLDSLWEVVRVRPLTSGEQIAAWELYVTSVTDGDGD